MSSDYVDRPAPVILVGHLDTGLDAEHPALWNKLADTYYLDSEGIAHAGRTGLPRTSHGTHTAGIICGDAVAGAQGIAPDARLCSVACKTSGKNLLQLLSGMDVLLARPIRIACMPIGVSQPTPVFAPFLTAFRQKNILAILPIGNGGAGKVLAPASYPTALAVGAINEKGRIATFSGNGGPATQRKPELLAPGVRILSASLYGKTKRLSGTSMACAWVAGAAARLLQVRPEASAAQIRQVLCNTALPPKQAHRCRYGIVQLEAALKAIQQDLLPLPEALDIPAPNQFERPYIDPHFLRKLKRARPGRRLEAIILPQISFSPEKEPGLAQVSSSLLRAVAQQVGHEPIAIRYFQAVDGAHVQADRSYFTALLDHPDLFVCSAVDVNIFGG